MKHFDPSHPPPHEAKGHGSFTQRVPNADPAAHLLVIMRLRMQLSADFRTSRCWAELQGRLMARGFILRACADGMMVCNHPGAEPIAAIEKIGVSCEQLTHRFGCRLPNSRAEVAQHAAREIPLRPAE